jgi:hypothetical protein
MEVVHNDLLLGNNSNTKIGMLLNLSYPDSSLSKAFPEQYRDPGDNSYIGNYFDLKTLPGLTLFVFEFNYLESRWNEQAGRPDTYLAEDSILARYVLSPGGPPSTWVSFSFIGNSPFHGRSSHLENRSGFSLSIC